MKNIFYLFFFLLALHSTAQQSASVLDSAHTFTFGGSNNDYARQIICTSDSGYIIVGTTSSFGVAQTDVYIIKTDKNITKQWSHLYGSPEIEWGYGIRETMDHGYIVVGYTNQNPSSGYDIYLLRLSSNGDVVWSKTIGGPDWDFGYGIELTPDSGFVICGKSYSYSNGSSDAYLVKTDKDGNVVWQKNYGGINDESANAIIRDHDNHYTIAGETNSFGSGDQDAWVLKTDENGDTLWARTFGTTLTDVANAIDTLTDGSFIVNGTSNGLRPGLPIDDMYFFKVDSLGNQVWYHEQGRDSLSDQGYIALTFPNGELFSGGITDGYGFGKTAFFMMRNDPGGWYLNSCAFGQSDDEEGYSAVIGKDNSLTLAGISSSFGCGFFDVYVIHIDTFTIVNDYNVRNAAVCDSTIGIDEAATISTPLSIYPNPFHDVCTVDLHAGHHMSKPFLLRMMDIAGKEISSFEVSRFPFQLNTEGLQSGIYFISISGDGFPQAKGKVLVY